MTRKRTCSRCGYEGHDRRQCGKVPPADERRPESAFRVRRPHRSAAPATDLAPGRRDRCGNCGEPGHKRRTCLAEKREVSPPPSVVARYGKNGYHKRARRRAALAVPELSLYVEATEAAPILRTLRPLVAEADPKRFLDSLMLLCYLRGMLAADAQWRRPATAVIDDIIDAGAGRIDEDAASRNVVALADLAGLEESIYAG